MSVVLTFNATLAVTVLDEYDEASIPDQIRQSVAVSLLRVPGVLVAEVVYEVTPAQQIP